MKSFCNMKEKIKKLAVSVLGYSIIAGIILFVIAAVVSGSVMRIFGFEYESVGSIILFFVVVMVAGFPGEILSSALPRALVSSGWSTEKQGTVFYVILDTLFSAAAMAFADYFMDSVSVSDLAILIISLLFAAASIKDFREKTRGEENENQKLTGRYYYGSSGTGYVDRDTAVSGYPLAVNSR